LGISPAPRRSELSRTERATHGRASVDYGAALALGTSPAAAAPALASGGGAGNGSWPCAASTRMCTTRPSTV
jgi:hypothetical protein